MERVVVVGASAGGVAALEHLVSGLPARFPAAVLVVLHLPVGYKSLLPTILSRAGPLPASDAEDGVELQAGHVYVAVPDQHLMVEDSHIRLTKGPRENGFRPSVDVLFRSAAYAWGSRAIGVVLSGALDDGASGLWAVKHVGGIGVVQHPSDAAYESMPVEALRRTDADYTVPAAEMGPLLARVVTEAMPPEPPHAVEFRQQLKSELDIAASDSAWNMGIMKLKGTPYTCPTCHGVMFEMREGSRRRFRCHTGHGYTMSSLLPMIMESSEESLWDALRAIQEAITLCHEAARDLADAGEQAAAQQLIARAERANQKLERLRSMSLRDSGLEAAG